VSKLLRTVVGDRDIDIDGPVVLDCKCEPGCNDEGVAEDV
jgi:hypothetical protein